MFSKIDQLNKNDSIYISNLNTDRIEYIIFDKYVTDEDNLSCTNSTSNIELTLVTCNKNSNRKRLIIKAKMKEL